MSYWLIAALVCIGVLAAGVRADEKQTPPAPAKADDTSKDRKPDFRAAAVRYQVKDVDKSVEFYTKHLGFKVEQQFGAGAPFASVSNGGSPSGLAARIVRGPAPCPMAASRSRAGGTGSSSKSMTCRRASRR